MEGGELNAHPPAPSAFSTTGDSRRPCGLDDVSGCNSGNIDNIRVTPSTPIRVPTASTLRMLLSVLKHSPAEIVKTVGVLLMLLASAIEVAGTSRASTLVNGGGGGGGVGRGDSRSSLRGAPQSVKRRADRDIIERQTEAAAMLALARRQRGPTTVTYGTSSGGGATKSSPTVPSKKRRGRLRQAAKVEEKVQAWAAKRGRNVSGLKALLGLSASIRPMDARLLNDRAARTSMEKASQALPEAGFVFEFILNAVDSTLEVSSTRSATVFDIGTAAARDSLMTGDGEPNTPNNNLDEKLTTRPIPDIAKIEEGLPVDLDLQHENGGVGGKENVDSPVQEIQSGNKGLICDTPPKSLCPASTGQSSVRQRTGLPACASSTSTNAGSSIDRGADDDSGDFSLASRTLRRETATAGHRDKIDTFGDHPLGRCSVSSSGTFSAAEGSGSAVATGLAMESGGGAVTTAERLPDSGESSHGEWEGPTISVKGRPPLHQSTAGKPQDTYTLRRGDPLGDVPLVTEEGERNAWDDILDEQLSKCPTLGLPNVKEAIRTDLDVEHENSGIGDKKEDGRIRGKERMDKALPIGQQGDKGGSNRDTRRPSLCPATTVLNFVRESLESPARSSSPSNNAGSSLVKGAEDSREFLLASGKSSGRMAMAGPRQKLDMFEDRASGRCSATSSGKFLAGSSFARGFDVGRGRGVGDRAGRRIILGGGGGGMGTCPSWESYVRQGVNGAKTDSWFFVPLLLEALGVSTAFSSYRFERPKGWGEYVNRYRNVLSEHRVSANRVVVNGGTYITASTQEDLMELEPIATAYIAEWIIDLRRSRGSVISPLPSLGYYGVGSI